ncbi:MAG: hypothetical protein PHH61_05625 [Candidatus Nanoarchaeia archaeon]|nr:hypothetical protein [Candidatus Nanoarchaeia archaeon]
MVDILAPEEDKPVVIQILEFALLGVTLLCFIGFAICAILNGMTENYLVLIISSLFSVISAAMFFVIRSVKGK